MTTTTPSGQPTNPVTTPTQPSAQPTGPVTTLVHPSALPPSTAPSMPNTIMTRSRTGTAINLPDRLDPSWTPRRGKGDVDYDCGHSGTVVCTLPL